MHTCIYNFSDKAIKITKRTCNLWHHLHCYFLIFVAKYYRASSSPKRKKLSCTFWQTPLFTWSMSLQSHSIMCIIHAKNEVCFCDKKCVWENFFVSLCAFILFLFFGKSCFWKKKAVLFKFWLCNIGHALLEDVPLHQQRLSLKKNWLRHYPYQGSMISIIQKTCCFED